MLRKRIFNVIISHNSLIIKRNLNDNQTSLQKYLQSKIKMTGPITVAEYMKECLGNPMLV